jgi:low temperature requirement protein LtrA
MTSETHGRFKRWFWRPPRAHGEIIADRQVSVLELFYDLVYVAVLGQAAHHLATHVSVRGLAEFAVVFALIWIAWINGSLYLELHGRQDGRTRSIVFVQMGILVLLAVFTADAADGSGRGFAAVYATYQAFQTGLWYTVWRQDRRDHPEFQVQTGPTWSASACRRRSSWPAPCSRPAHGSWCGPASPWPGSSASCWPPGPPAPDWA